jgi:hypothetical protein
MPPDEARALIIDVVQRRLARLDDLSHWIDARRPNGRVVLRRALAEAAAGAWSLPEADLARLLSRSSVVPEPWLNPELRDADGGRLTTPDLWLDDVAMAVMVHSREFHSGVIDWESTVERDSDLSACGVVVVGVTPGAIARDPARVLDRIERAYATALRPVAAPTWWPRHGLSRSAGCSAREPPGAKGGLGTAGTLGGRWATVRVLRGSHRGSCRARCRDHDGYCDMTRDMTGDMCPVNPSRDLTREPDP